ncbi:hypothetical protein [Prosthecobacter sp.]|uniref:hypothetical protein n=1 Tax=Prosthecobacter sp. TaxID=1965333 RepID=UPI0037850CA0
MNHSIEITRSEAMPTAVIRRFCADQGHRLTGVSWEIYGHWDESWNKDASKIRTDVFYQLEDCTSQTTKPA